VVVLRNFSVVLEWLNRTVVAEPPESIASVSSAATVLLTLAAKVKANIQIVLKTWIFVSA
jgi:hypothetical protein